MNLSKYLSLDIYCFKPSFVVYHWKVVAYKYTIHKQIKRRKKNITTRKAQTKSHIMPSILLNSTHITTEKLMPMVEATTKAAAVAAIPITKTTSTIITNLSAVSSNGQNKRTIIIYPTGGYFNGHSVAQSIYCRVHIKGHCVSF